MPLFICDECGVVENTALTACSWGQERHLCSQCCPSQNKWHGIFPREFTMPKGEKDIFNKGE